MIDEGAAGEDRPLVGIYLRAPADVLDGWIRHPPTVSAIELHAWIRDGRALDLGRAWEALGVFIDGGIRLPSTGPTVGVTPLLPEAPDAAWASVSPAETVAFAADLRRLGPGEFAARYAVDAEDSVEIPDSRTGGWGSQRQYIFKKLEALKAHYAIAAAAGEGMLVRIGPRPRRPPA
ncbi:MAG: DUF1877 family protein [Myxococcota bacterium]